MYHTYGVHGASFHSRVRARAALPVSCRVVLSCVVLARHVVCVCVCVCVKLGWAVECSTVIMVFSYPCLGTAVAVRNPLDHDDLSTLNCFIHPFYKRLNGDLISL